MASRTSGESSSVGFFVTIDRLGSWKRRGARTVESRDRDILETTSLHCCTKYRLCERDIEFVGRQHVLPWVSAGIQDFLNAAQKDFVRTTWVDLSVGDRLARGPRLDRGLVFGRIGQL